MKHVTHTCDKCGKEFDKSNQPPWEPDFCPECRAENAELMRKLNNSTWANAGDHKLRTWL